MCTEDAPEWLQAVMSKVIDSLGRDVDEYELLKPIESLMSNRLYVRVKFKDTFSTSENNGATSISLILKRIAYTEMEIRRMFSLDEQFHNESVFYRMYAQPDDNLPRCYHAGDCRSPPDDTVIVLENVSERGYQPCSYVTNVPLEYTLAAMRELGRFHGKGYVMKELRRDRFLDMVARFRRINFQRDNILTILIERTATRAVEYLRGRGHAADFCDRAEALLGNATVNVVMRAMEPCERLSTLCHGDFTLGNTLFKPAPPNAYRAMLIDFACLVHATPAVDLSTYLCLNAPDELNCARFEDVMRAYHDALRDYLLDHGVHVSKYPYEAFLEDFKRNGLYGFCIASFYLPILLGYFAEATNPRYLLKTGVTVCVDICRQIGGDNVSRILADTLLRLRDLGCLEHAL